MIKRILEFQTATLLDEQFDYPHKAYPTIHVVGTDGKGSTSNMISSILIDAGYKVGMFNTPGIKGRNDTIKINGKAIPKEELDILKAEVENICNEHNIPIVRWVNVHTVIAFLYFKKENVDIAVIEACKGGATDPTNVIQPLFSLITNITPDHLEVFGNDFMTYVNEKAGVIKPNIPTYVSETPKDEKVKNVLIEKAVECQTSLTFVDEEENNFIIKQYGDGKYLTKFGEFSMSLGGDYQYHNLNFALNAIQKLRLQGYNISDNNIISGLNHIYENTGLCGRWQVLQNEPKVILDMCHTVDSFKKVIPQLLNSNYNKLHIILGLYENRDVESIIKMFPDDENIEYYFPKTMIRRLARPERLMKASNWMKKSKRHISTFISQTISSLSQNCNENDIIFAGGNGEYVDILNKVS